MGLLLISSTLENISIPQVSEQSLLLFPTTGEPADDGGNVLVGTTDLRRVLRRHALLGHRLDRRGPEDIPGGGQGQAVPR